MLADQGVFAMDDVQGKSNMDAPEHPQAVLGFTHFGHLELKGVDNARDLGGMPTKDGRHVRPGRLMRSGDLHDATSSDMRVLAAHHGLVHVVDLRTSTEVKQKEDPFGMMPDITYVDLPVLTEQAIGIDSIADRKADAHVLKEVLAHSDEFLQELYRKCVRDEAGIAAYRRFLNDLLTVAEGATLWHCTQGKDRTGLAAVFVEHALGVPMDFIKDDYLATNLFIHGWIERTQRLLADKPGVKGIEKVLEAFGYARLIYLDAALEAIDEAYGCLDDYLAVALDFGEDKRKKFQELYLA